MRSAEKVATGCLLCGDGSGGRPVTDGLLRRCDTCQFVWTASDLPPPEQLYDRAYYETDGYQDYFTSAGQRRYESARRLRWLRSRVRPATLLEAGSAGGYFLRAARDAGIDARGVEVSDAAASFAREQLGVPVRTDRFEDHGPGAPVDAVCAFHVLEHVTDPRRFLAAARAALRPDGWLALEVPNIASAAARRLGSAWPAIAPDYHRWHFTPHSLARLLAESGFRVVGQDTVFSRFYWRAPARLRQARNLVVADFAACRSLQVSHPTLGDLLRVFARREDR
ncbi:class I SAM-dependent methyltransferase [Solwaraspora sp. WMMA2080]|uniref:class I SAM-dependent methyltransferase n=1 Tax=unclassified Solwaraspora TaxID=2627926 RepID=UPI00248CAE73|nr:MULTISPECIES: class I SAM-dependent methyltransferase [unclassified Solwaraspora]WBB97819.1 class I SAM-dependent methyltransferase [Solwaraspora sp. WMMA2059]WBC18291.1 class I SAM-dependent methyltransferase [Solwaraspora sp. WMMA2080]